MRDWLERGEEERGLGDNLHVVRALSNIQGLGMLEISGYYAKHWPAYLEEKMGVPVRAKDGHNEELNDEMLLRKFREYQQGTEDLVP